MQRLGTTGVKAMSVLSHSREIAMNKIYNYQNISFHQSDDYLSTAPCVNFNFNRYVDNVTKYIEENNIDYIFGVRDVSDLISSIICTENNKYFKNYTPSIESILICLHKPLTRYYCDIINPKQYNFFKMDDYKTLSKCNELLQSIGGI
eukprot:77833_1